MDDKDIPTLGVHPWHPMTDPVDLKHMSKIAEEGGELCSAAARCMAQGIDEKDPRSQKVNREWIEDEIADVRANSRLVIERFNLNEDRIEARAVLKMNVLRQWHGMA